MKKPKFHFNKNIILGVISVPLLVAIGVISGNYIANPNMIAASVNEEVEVSEEVTVPLDEFVLNLEPMHNVNRYVRLEISLSTTKEDGEVFLKENTHKIRDAIISTVSRQQVNDIFDQEVGTSHLKDLLKEAINKEFEEEIISQVYITNVVVQ